MSFKIKRIKSQELLDSRGNPTVEATVILENGFSASAMVPSGASTGIYEAYELRDNDPDRYLGKGVLRAVANVEEKIGSALIGMDSCDQKAIDNKMIEVDASVNKKNLGANAILAVSMANMKVAALAQGLELFEYTAKLFGNPTDKYVMPIPMINVLNGGKHAIKSSDFQEYMIMPVGAPSICEAVRWGSEVFHVLGSVIKDMNFSTTVGDEGGYAPSLTENDDDPAFLIDTMHDPSLPSNEEAIALLKQSIGKAGYKAGEQISIAMDSAASEILENGAYVLKTENRVVTAGELLEMYSGWLDKYPIVSIEDPFDQDDWDAYKEMTRRLGNRIQIVGDDFFVTNVMRLKKGIELGACNSILIKLNQIGTVTETIEAIQMAKKAGYTAIVSHRSGETEDSFIADFVVGAGTGQIKTGSMSRTERVSKYNRLMTIERRLGDRAVIAKFPFGR